MPDKQRECGQRFNLYALLMAPFVLAGIGFLIWLAVSMWPES